MHEEKQGRTTKTDVPEPDKIRQQHIRIMERYMNGTEKEKREIEDYFANFLYPFVTSEVRKIRGKVDNDFEDYVQDAILNCLRNLPKYNPAQKGGYKVFFHYPILEQVSKTYDESTHKTSYECAIDKKVAELKKELEKAGEIPTVGKIASMSGLTINQVQDSLIRIEQQGEMLVWDFSPYEKEISTFNNPSDVLLKQELDACLEHAMSKLSPEIRKAIAVLYGFDNLPELSDEERFAILKAEGFFDDGKKAYKGKEARRYEMSIAKAAAILKLDPARLTGLKNEGEKQLKRDVSLSTILIPKKKETPPAASYEGDPIEAVFCPDADEYRNLGFYPEDEWTITGTSKRAKVEVIPVDVWITF